MKQQLFKVKEPKRFDFILIGIIIMLACTSFLAIYTAFPLIARNGGPEILTKQVQWYIIGFVAMAVLMYLGNDSIYPAAKVIYWFLLIALIYLLINKEIINRFLGASVNLPFVLRVNGATSWFIVGGLGSFQPSEFMKIVLIIITAGIINEHNAEKIADTFQSDIDLFIKVAKWAIPPILMILLQPDTGIVIVIGFSLSVMLMCSGIKREWIWFILVAGIIILLIFFYLYYFQFNFLSSLFGSNGAYKLSRITSWLNPESDILNTGNQSYTALMALGSAGLMGFGIQSDLGFNIPEAQTDFIFAIFGHGFGLIGALFILSLCLALDLRLIKIAKLSKNNFEKFYICGILGMLVFQQLQNIGMIVGLLPITGITLPLISYGGSSLLSYMLAFGIVMNASVKAKKLSDYIYS